MTVKFRSHQNITIAVVTGALDAVQGQHFAYEVCARVLQGGKLIVDGGGLSSLTPEGLNYLIKVQQWCGNPERRRLLLAGFGPRLWQVIVNQKSEILFEATEALPEAIDSLGAEAAASELETPGGVLSPDSDASETLVDMPQPDRFPPRPPVAPPAAVSTSRFPTAAWPSAPPPPGSQPIARPTPAPLPPITAAAPAAPPVAPPPDFTHPGKAGFPRTLLFPLIGGVLVILLLAGTAGWFYLSKRPPVVSVSSASVTAEEDGKEVDEVTVEVQRGKLMEASWKGMPPGLFFEPANDGAANGVYLLRGKAENGARNATVQLEAMNARGGRSPLVPFTVEVKEKPLSWQLATLLSLKLKANTPLEGESKFVTGATEASAARGLPPGLRVELTPGTTRDWQLAGTPAAGGRFTVAFKASTFTGTTEEKTCTLQVDEEPTGPVIDGLGQTSTSISIQPPPPDIILEGAAGGGMRKFLLDRIEKLPSRYSDEEREKLRQAVNELKQSQQLAHLIFERVGQTKVSDDQAAKFRAALSTPEIQALLENPGCQVAIVGYASKTGSLAANVRISKLRARNVNDLFSDYIGREADLCGDYGPTDIVNRSSESANQAVEVYVGIMNLSPELRAKATSFRNTFNYQHGLR